MSISLIVKLLLIHLKPISFETSLFVLGCPDMKKSYHLLLKQRHMLLGEGYGLLSRNIICIFTGKHAIIALVQLQRNLLCCHAVLLPFHRVQIFIPSHFALILQVLENHCQDVWSLLSHRVPVDQWSSFVSLQPPRSSGHPDVPARGQCSFQDVHSLCPPFYCPVSSTLQFGV